MLGLCMLYVYVYGRQFQGECMGVGMWVVWIVVSKMLFYVLCHTMYQVGGCQLTPHRAV